MRRLLYLLPLVLLLAAISCRNSQKTKTGETLPESTYQENPVYTVAFYNVENLFDLENNPDKEDDEFTPSGENKWTQERYNKKLNDLARVISSIDTAEAPELVGLSEVENQKVVADLMQQKQFSEFSYKVVHEQSPDFRGIDVALAYRTDAFHYLEHEAIPVTLPAEPDYATRDILYVKGVAEGTDTLNIYVNHWSSRYGGREASEYKRVNAAEILKEHIAALRDNNPRAKIVIMGDMNDEPQNISLSETLNAGNARQKGQDDFYNLMYDADLKGKGTYNYQGTWNMLDNMVVSYSLLNNEQGYHVQHSAGRIFDREWMRYYFPENDGYSPNRTYGGPNYYGGISDHFPVYFQMKAKE